jgi:hypothetical protein
VGSAACDKVFVIFLDSLVAGEAGMVRQLIAIPGDNHSRPNYFIASRR